MKESKKIIALLSALIITVLSGCGKKEESSNKIVYYDDSNAYTQNAERTEDSDGNDFEEEIAIENVSTIPAAMNEKAEISGIDITLKNVYSAGEVNYGDDLSSKKQVIALNCDVTNNTDSDITINSFNFTIQYVDGEYMQSETGMREIMSASRKITNINALNTSIEPGKTASGYAALSVLPNWQTITVYFSPHGGSSKSSVTFDITKDMLEEP